MPSRAAYVHVPFCARRCGYCNFTLVAGRNDLREDYLRAVELELNGLNGPHEIDTLFFGGGTPTQLLPDQLSRLIALVRRTFPLAAGHEFSVEANPADVNAELVAVMLAGSVNRISLGAQSFRREKLVLLERDHRPEDVARSFALCRPFPSVGLDLIFAAPQETLAEWEADLAAALALQPDHLSTYGLTFEKGTTFWSRKEKGELAGAGEDLELAMYAAALDRLTAAGYEHYEVSNFARPGSRCRHNEAYWLGDEYFAVGPGAARFIDGRRETNHRSTTTYLQKVLAGQSPVVESEHLPPEEAARERFVFGLRRLEGVRREPFAARMGVSLDALVGPLIRRFVEQGFLTDDGETVRLTRAGLFICDALCSAFLRA